MNTVKIRDIEIGAGAPKIIVPIVGITKEDIMASINYNMHLEYGIGNDDDIDHLGLSLIHI